MFMDQKMMLVRRAIFPNGSLSICAQFQSSIRPLF